MALWLSDVERADKCVRWVGHSSADQILRAGQSLACHL